MGQWLERISMKVWIQRNSLESYQCLWLMIKHKIIKTLLRIVVIRLLTQETELLLVGQC